MKKNIIFLPLFLSFLTAKSQDLEKRVSIYLNAGIEKEITEKFSTGLEIEGRFCKSQSEQDLLLKPYIEFSPVKYFSLGAEYRWDLNHQEGSQSSWSGRLGLYAKAKYGFHGFKAEARFKYCNYSEDYGYWNVDDKVYDQSKKLNYLRPKFQLSYKIKPLKLTPYVSYEWFYNTARGLVDKDRWTFGLKKKINKIHTLGFEYKFEEKFNRLSKKGNVKDDINNNIFAFSYKYSF